MSPPSFYCGTACLPDPATLANFEWLFADPIIIAFGQTIIAPSSRGEAQQLGSGKRAIILDMLLGWPRVSHSRDIFEVPRAVATSLHGLHLVRDWKQCQLDIEKTGGVWLRLSCWMDKDLCRRRSLVASSVGRASENQRPEVQPRIGPIVWHPPDAGVKQRCSRMC